MQQDGRHIVLWCDRFGVIWKALIGNWPPSRDKVAVRGENIALRWNIATICVRQCNRNAQSVICNGATRIQACGRVQQLIKQVVINVWHP